MNYYSNFWSRLLKLGFVLLTASLLTGCAKRPKIHYIKWNPANGISLNVWERADDTFWYTTKYEETAIAEFERVTGQELDTIPLYMYGFFIWTDGDYYHITQQK